MIYMESSFEESTLIDNDLFLEAQASDTYILRDHIYPKIEKVLSTAVGQRKFANLVGNYINKNSKKLTTIGPVYQLAFTPYDEEPFFSLFEININEVKQVIKEITKKINSNSQWVLLRQHPIYVIFYFVIRFFTIMKDSKQLNNALIIMALSMYPSVFKHYFQYEVNIGVMQYTIDNLSQRFIIKKTNHIFGTLTYSIQNSWKFHEKNIMNGSDAKCIDFVRRIRNDQNSLLKKIANNYYENHKKGLSVYTTVDSFDDSIVVDNENDTNKIEAITNRIVTQILVNGINLKLVDFAASVSKTSKIELRNYLTKIAIEKNSNNMKSFIESILFIYLYDNKHTTNEINSEAFIGFALSLFKKSNSKDKNIGNIKGMLDKWGNESGLYTRFSRLATRVDYTKGIYLYFIMCIQHYN